jgi:hypothetical protein
MAGDENRTIVGWSACWHEPVRADGCQETRADYDSRLHAHPVPAKKPEPHSRSGRADRQATRPTSYVQRNATQILESAEPLKAN